MGPIQQSPLLVSPADYDKETATCKSKAGVSNKPTKTSNKKFTLKKIPISQDVMNMRADSLKSIVSTIQKLANLDVPEELIQYGTPWFEGPLAEECYKITETDKPLPLQPISSAGNSTFLCVPVETYDYVNLRCWLDDRESEHLFESQIFNIILQIITAISYLEQTALQKFCKPGISLSDVHILVQGETSESLCAQDKLLPRLKFANLDFEMALSLKDPEEDSSETKCSLRCIAHAFMNLLERNDSTILNQCTEGTEVSSQYPEEWQIIQEMLTCEIENDTYQNLIANMKDLQSKYSADVVLNICEPCKHFIDKEQNVEKLRMKISESNNSGNVYILQGPAGSGKSEFIQQLSKILIQEQTSIILLNASNGDCLRKMTYHCMTHPKLSSIATKDYIGNPRPLKDIFQDMLHYFNDKNLLLVLDNVNEATEEVSDFLQGFRENSKCEISGGNLHTLIITTTEPLHADGASMQDYPVIFPPSNINVHDSVQSLQKQCGIIQDGQKYVESLSKIMQNHTSPAALNILSRFILRTCSMDNFNQAIQRFAEKFPTFEIFKSESNSTEWLAYALSLQHILDLLDEQHSFLIKNILSVLQFMNSDIGLHTNTLAQILGKLPQVKQICKEESIKGLTKTCLNYLQKFGLATIKDDIIRLTNWMHFPLKQSFKFLFPTEETKLSEVAQSLLSILIAELPNESSESDPQINIRTVLPHIAKIWTELKSHYSDAAKQFDNVPALVATQAIACNKFEEFTCFLKQACDIFCKVLSNPYDFHVLNLRHFLAVHSLLPMAKINEAFIILKMISEQSLTDPREFLMLKLKSIIEVGHIYTIRQDYDKAISCFQQVQIFAAQKISILELDSEPTVLKSRMLHGNAHIQQGNSEEGKKILLQVVPLLERYSGKETYQVKMLLLQAKFYLATVLRKCGDLVNALMMQTKVLGERRKLFGKKHPDVWESKREMAMLYSSYDNHEKALELLKDLLEVQEEVLGAPSNRQSLATMNSIAEIESRLGNFDDALELYEAIDLIEQQVLAENDQMRITSQVNQADVLMALGQYKEAVDIFDLVSALLRSSPDDQRQKNNQALSQDLISKKEKAERSMEVLGNYWLSLTPENVDDPSELAALAKKHEVATELSENQDNHGALRFLREVLEDCTHLEETNRFHLNVKADLARVLGLVGRFNESFSVYKEILPLMDATFGETDELTMLCKDTMGQVFLFSGNQFLKRQMSNLKWFLF